jgi:hypothetical protein
MEVADDQEGRGGSDLVRHGREVMGPAIEGSPQKGEGTVAHLRLFELEALLVQGAEAGYLGEIGLGRRVKGGLRPLLDHQHLLHWPLGRDGL